MANQWVPLGTYNDAGVTAADKAAIEQAQREYAAAQAAGNKDGMKTAHAKAEGIRAGYSYSGGIDGSDYLGFGKSDGGNGNISNYMGALNPYGVKPKDPTLMGLGIGDTYGLKYNYDEILGILNNATNASIAAQNQEMQKTENQFLNTMVAGQSQSLDAIRKSQAAAIATGASKGIAAASELSSILGMQGQTALGATDLANQKNMLTAEQQAAMAKNAQTALDTSNQVKMGIGNLDLTKYGYDTQQSAAILDYLASIAGTAGDMYNSDQTLSGVKYNADKNLEGSQYTADQNLEGNMYNSNYGYGGRYNPLNYNNGGGGSSGSGSGTGNSTDNTGTGTVTPQPQSINTPAGTMKMNSDGTWTLQTSDAEGNNVNINISADEKAAIEAEGTVDAVKKAGYASGIFDGKEITHGTKIVAGGKTYTYDKNKYGFYLDGKFYGPTAVRKIVASDNIAKSLNNNFSPISDKDANLNPTAMQRWVAAVNKSNRYVVVHKNGTWSVELAVTPSGPGVGTPNIGIDWNKMMPQ